MYTRNGKFFYLLAMACSLMLSAPSHAASFNFGFGLGKGKVTVNQDAFDDGSLTSQSIDPDTFSLVVYGETSFNRNLRLEFGVIDSGLAKMDGYSNGSTSYWWPGSVSAEYGLVALKVGVVGVLPLDANDRFKLLGKVGMAPWISIVNLSGTYIDDTETDSGISPYYGAGAEVDLTKLISLRLQYEAFSASADSLYFSNGYDFKYSSTSLGLLFRF